MRPWVAAAGALAGCAADPGPGPRGGQHDVSSTETGVPRTGSDTALPPGGPWPWRSVSAGVNAACAVDDRGALHCWGQPHDPILAAPPGAWQAVSLGAESACGLTESGELTCWGRDTWGEARPPEGAGYRSVDCGQDRCCATTAAGDVACWGVVPEGPLARADALSVGGYQACGLVAGRVGCDGEAPPGEGPPDGRFDDLSVGHAHACALGGGEVRCWGSDRDGRLDVPDLGAHDVSAGRAVTCALDEEGGLRCWGDPGDAGPVDRPPSGRFAAVSVGWFVACALPIDGGIRCWGHPRLPDWGFPG